MNYRPSTKYKVLGTAILLCGLILPAAEALLADPGSESVMPALDARVNPIRVTTALISVPVSVTTGEGAAVQGLTIDDFRVLEDEAPVTISGMLVAARSPMQLALLVDLSGSIRDHFELEIDAAERFLENVWRQGDTISIISFSGSSKIHLENSGSLSDALHVLHRLEPRRGATAFFDAIVETARLLGRTETELKRQAIIVLSDGADNLSDHGIAKALDTLKRANILFYSINPSGASVRLNRVNRRGQENLEELAAVSGGMAFVLEHASETDAIFAAIATDFSAQYLLNYYSPHPYRGGVYRHIRVSVPEKPGLRIRARPGYITATDAP